MSCSGQNEGQSGAAWVKDTLIYRQWEAMRRDILQHKWFESEKAGYDIGWDRAVVDWMIKYGASRRSNSDTEKESF